MHVGGEFSKDERWKLPERRQFPGQTGLSCFLNGGQACLRVISDWLVHHGINKILLPAYLCPSISGVFDQYSIRMDFYRVRKDFTIDLDHLYQLVAANPIPAIYFINYFGFTLSKEESDFLLGFKQRGMTIVEDNAQAGFHDHPIGDFVFNSLRKLCAYDGAYLNTGFPVREYIDRYSGRINHRLPLIRRYRERYADYLAGGDIEIHELEELFDRSESFYKTDGVVEGDAIEKVAIECLDWASIHQVRRDNYRYLMNLLSGIREVTPIFPALQDENMPFGLPVYFSGVSRDVVNTILGNASIGLTIHWEEMHKPPFTPVQDEAVAMSDGILTLNVDQYTSRAQLDYLAEQLHTAVKQAKKH